MRALLAPLLLLPLVAFAAKGPTVPTHNGELKKAEKSLRGWVDGTSIDKAFKGLVVHKEHKADGVDVFSRSLESRMVAVAVAWSVEDTVHIGIFGSIATEDGWSLLFVDHESSEHLPPEEGMPMLQSTAAQMIEELTTDGCNALPLATPEQAEAAFGNENMRTRAVQAAGTIGPAMLELCTMLRSAPGVRPAGTALLMVDPGSSGASAFVGVDYREGSWRTELAAELNP